MDHLGQKRLIQLKRLECKLLPPKHTGTDDWTVASGSATATKSILYNSIYDTLPTPTRAGTTFSGWQLVPNEYQQVDYIQTTGGEYIATGVKGTAIW